MSKKRRDQFKRSSYDAAFKLSVVEYAEKHGNMGAQNEYCVSEKVVRDWRKQKAVLVTMPKNKRAARYSISPYEELERDLSRWVCEALANGLTVTRKDMRTKALLLAEERQKYNIQGQFLASSNWCTRFINRHNLEQILKNNKVKKTKVSKKKLTTNTDTDDMNSTQ